MEDSELAIGTLVNRLERKCKARGLDFSSEDLEDEILDAIDAVNNRRQYVPTSSMPYEKKYESLIVRLALCSLTKYGAEGEKAHSENGINRTYGSSSNYPEALLLEIVPLAHSRGSISL